MNNERLLHLAEKYGTEFAKEVLKSEAGQHTEKSESETVADMRNLQAEGNLERMEISEGVRTMAKNSPKMLANTDEIKRSAAKL